MKILENVTEFNQKLRSLSVVWKMGICFPFLEPENSAAKTKIFFDMVFLLVGLTSEVRVHFHLLPSGLQKVEYKMKTLPFFKHKKVLKLIIMLSVFLFHSCFSAVFYSEKGPVFNICQFRITIIADLLI